jgi:uncharacterized protein YpmS
MDDVRGKNRRDLDPEDDMDVESQKPKIKSSCSLFSIFALLVILFIILCGGIFYLKYKNFKIAISDSQNSDSVMVTNQLQNQISSVKSGEVATIKVTESDLNQIIKESSNFPLKNPSAKIQSDQVVVSGKTSAGFFGIPLDIGVVPEVKSGKLVFNITSIKTAGVPAPKQVSDSINSSLQQYLNGSLPLANNIDVKTINLTTGLITITGQKH